MNLSDVVVPAHNEASRIAPVLAAISGSPYVASLIVVADDCCDDTAAVAGAWATEVVAVDAHDKGTAMAAGLMKVATDTVVFVDADLSGLRPEHVSALVTFDPLDGQLVGVPGLRSLDIPTTKVVASLPSISGQRRLPTWVARSVPLAGSGWRAETLLNVAVTRLDLPHRQIILKGVANRSKVVRSPWAWAKEVGQVVDTAACYGPELLRYMGTEQ